MPESFIQEHDPLLDTRKFESEQVQNPPFKISFELPPCELHWKSVIASHCTSALQSFLASSRVANLLTIEPAVPAAQCLSDSFWNPSVNGKINV